MFKNFSIFNSGSHFVQWSRMILEILLKGPMRNITMKLFLNWDICLGGFVV